MKFSDIERPDEVLEVTPTDIIVSRDDLQYKIVGSCPTSNRGNECAGLSGGHCKGTGMAGTCVISPQRRVTITAKPGQRIARRLR